MTLKNMIKSIEMVASSQPAINMIVENDIFRLNSASDAKYGVFAWTQGQHSASIDSSLMKYSFTFFYVDRLTESQDNMIEVQSVGIQTLDNIIRTLEESGIIASDYNFQTFNQRFLDECAGVFCSVSFDAPIALSCGEDYPVQYINNDVIVW